MIEYLYDAIRATSGDDIGIAANITDETGEENCNLKLFDEKDNLIATVDGIKIDDFWDFTIPKVITSELHGRYFYCIYNKTEKMQFKQPIYFV